MTESNTTQQQKPYETWDDILSPPDRTNQPLTACDDDGMRPTCEHCYGCGDEDCSARECPDGSVVWECGSFEPDLSPAGCAARSRAVVATSFLPGSTYICEARIDMDAGTFDVILMLPDPAEPVVLVRIDVRNWHIGEPRLLDEVEWDSLEHFRDPIQVLRYIKEEHENFVKYYSAGPDNPNEDAAMAAYDAHFGPGAERPTKYITMNGRYLGGYVVLSNSDRVLARYSVADHRIIVDAPEVAAARERLLKEDANKDENQMVMSGYAVGWKNRDGRGHALRHNGQHFAEHEGQNERTVTDGDALERLEEVTDTLEEKPGATECWIHPDLRELATRYYYCRLQTEQTRPHDPQADETYAALPRRREALIEAARRIAAGEVVGSLQYTAQLSWQIGNARASWAEQIDAPGLEAAKIAAGERAAHGVMKAWADYAFTQEDFASRRAHCSVVLSADGLEVARYNKMWEFVTESAGALTQISLRPVECDCDAWLVGGPHMPGCAEVRALGPVVSKLVEAE